MVLCDDNEIVLHFMKKKLEDIFMARGVSAEVAAFTRAAELLECCREEVCDFALLDIEMPEMNGFQLAGKLKDLPQENQPCILFVSGLEDIVYRTFQYQPFDFLRKSHLEEDMEEKIGRLLRACDRDYSDNGNQERITLVRGEDACLYLKDVCYFKSERNHLEAFTKTGSYRCRDRLIHMAEKLSKDFIQTDKQHLVNMQQIGKIRKDNILLRDGRRVPLSRRRKKYVEEVYFRFTEQDA